jgi:hypothetical protein
MWGGAPTFLEAEEAFELARGLEADRTLELGDFEREAVAEEDLDGVLERPREDIVVVYMMYLPPRPPGCDERLFLGVGGATSNATACSRRPLGVVDSLKHNRASRAYPAIFVAWRARGHEAPQTTSSTLASPQLPVDCR